MPTNPGGRVRITAPLTIVRTEAQREALEDQLGLVSHVQKTLTLQFNDLTIRQLTDAWESFEADDEDMDGEPQVLLRRFFEYLNYVMKNG